MKGEKLEKQIKEFNKKIQGGYKVNFSKTKQKGKTTIIALEKNKESEFTKEGRKFYKKNTFAKQKLLEDYYLSNQQSKDLIKKNNPELFALIKEFSKEDKESVEELKIKKEYNKIFYKKINEYNKKSDFSTHYIRLGNKVMEICFDNSWKYYIYNLEEG